MNESVKCFKNKIKEEKKKTVYKRKKVDGNLNGNTQ